MGLMIHYHEEHVVLYPRDKNVDNHLSKKEMKMSYKVAGKVEEWGFDVEKSTLTIVKLIPDEEYTLKQGNKKILVIRDEDTQDAKWLEYDKYISLEFTGEKQINIATQLIGAKGITLTFPIIKQTVVKDASIKNVDTEDAKGMATGFTVSITADDKTEKTLVCQLGTIGIKP